MYNGFQPLDQNVLYKEPKIFFCDFSINKLDAWFQHISSVKASSKTTKPAHT